jgi:hypothetical protein
MIHRVSCVRAIYGRVEDRDRHQRFGRVDFSSRVCSLYKRIRETDVRVVVLFRAGRFLRLDVSSC